MSEPAKHETNAKHDNRPKSVGLLGGVREMGVTSYLFMLLGIVCLLLTLFITWPLWNVRTDPPNLVWFDGTVQISFGLILVLTSLYALVSPKIGTLVVWVLLGVSMILDVTRCQPQMFALPILISACVWPSFRRVAIWFLISMWFWAGVHKYQSEYWFGPYSFFFLDRMDFPNAETLYWPYAWVVTITEVSLAILVLWKRKWAAVLCVFVHVGIMLTMLLIQWNFSVVPWNLATAVVGAWLLWTFDQPLLPKSTYEYIAVPVLVVVPVGVYFGWTPNYFSHVLYSDELPQPIVTTDEGFYFLQTWDTLNAATPRTYFALKKYFELIAKPNQKLHILDSRNAIDDSFYIKESTGKIRKISSREFFSDQSGYRGIAADYQPATFKLKEAGVEMQKRSSNEMIFAVRFSPENYTPDLLEQVRFLPNVEQIQLEGCDVDDGDLEAISKLPVLNGIGLNNTALSDNCLQWLEEIPTLRVIQIEGTAISAEKVKELLRQNAIE